MTHTEAKELLKRHDQGHVLQFWEQLDAVQCDGLLNQVAGLDWETLARIRTIVKNKAVEGGATVCAGIEPAPVVSLSASEQVAPRSEGEKALRSGKVGVILVAGGQGTRLGYDGPKGTFRLAPLSRASLFEIHSRKILAMERRYGAPIPFYIMTSEGNDAATRSFFHEHRFFGLDQKRVKFFTQGTLPAFWPDGRIVLESPGKLFAAPDGHGGILTALDRRGMLADMKIHGVTTLFYFQVDNPMVEIADPVFVGCHLQRGAEMSLKVCAKRDPAEGLGVVVVRDGRQAVVEYTELTDEQKRATRADGDLLFKFGSVAIHLFSLEFLRREAAAGLPLHQAHKKVGFCDEAGKPVKPTKANAYKFEKFIFDALPDARTSVILEFSREDEFAPVKNAEGEDSPATSQVAMMEKFARWMSFCGVVVPRDEKGRLVYRLEVDPLYANSAEELKKRLPQGFSINGEVQLVENTESASA
jgi:UDP-N-acetylglucosamine/UDP-N-acetylgalactosamine diphosphorylase